MSETFFRLPCMSQLARGGTFSLLNYKENLGKEKKKSKASGSLVQSTIRMTSQRDTSSRPNQINFRKVEKDRETSQK